MIEKIKIIKGVASFCDDDAILDKLSSNNFIYGSNGSGKTTISRIIAEEHKYPDCCVTWRGNNKLETLVYNRDFVDKNFSQDSKLKGVFTLGEEDATAIKQIENAKKEIEKYDDDIQSRQANLNGKDGNSGKIAELQELENQFELQSWQLKSKYDDVFKTAFSGSRGKKSDFKNKLITESVSNSVILLTFEILKKKTETIFVDNLEKELLIQAFEYDDPVEFEGNPILTKKVIGKLDVDIAAMIQKLGNSDWVKEGRIYFERNDDYCPFCQQTTEIAFAKSLNEYFDETYLTDMNEIKNLITSYHTFSEKVIKDIQAVIELDSKYLDIEKLETQKKLVELTIGTNRRNIERKQKEASLVITLEPLTTVLNEIKDVIAESNKKICEHNRLVDNIANEKISLISQIWRYVTNEIKPTYDNYNVKKSSLDRAIKGLQDGVKNKQREKQEKENEIRALEKTSTSIQPTIDNINGLLSSFGFTGFSLKKSETEGYYQIIRASGVDAKETLSEEEKTFITFLYFYHLLKGSNSENGVTTDRVVVFDDPVSSLDSDVLFMVSSLIKGIFDEIRNNQGHIKQIFILTHNVYFHKEITFNSKRKNGVLKDETFWIVKKSGKHSKIQKYIENPIKTSYELLWNEVKDPNRSSLTIQNTLRRILENYFKILGNLDNDEIINKFQGKEKLVCRSLFSWVNDGSHFANDDLYVACDNGTVDFYLEVFKKIFDESKHTAHYNMMMGITDE
jgi:wobble nucleotide-excising tRNase